MGRFDYYSYDAQDAYQRGERDAIYGHRSYDYDRYGDSERDKAYFDGYREQERRIEERREEARMEEERECRRQEQIAYERRMEAAAAEEEYWYNQQCQEEQYYQDTASTTISTPSVSAPAKQSEE